MAHSLAVLFAVNILNFYDRQVLGALIEPARKEFQCRCRVGGRIACMQSRAATAFRFAVLLFLGAGGASRIRGAAAAGAFTMKVDPDQVFFPGPALIAVVNNGTESITAVSLRDSELWDKATNATLAVPAQTFDDKTALNEMPIQPGSNAVLHVQLGSKPGAGTYSGSLRFRSAGGVSQDVAITVRARGANSLLLFFVILLCGYCAALGLQWWLDNAQRLRLIASLGDLQRELQTVRRQVREWLLQKHAAAPGTMTRFDGQIHQVVNTLDQSGQLDTGTLSGREAAARETLDALNAFQHALEQAAVQYEADPNALPGAVTALDEVAAAPLQQYQANLEAALKNVGAAEAGPAVAAATQGKLWLARTLLKIVPTMLYILPLLLALGFSYFTIYDPRKDFGSIRDYFNLFAQSLGITQAGGQALKQGHQWAGATAAKQGA
ncbi:MAG: hypothetical protein ABSG65_03860 [Bryobacteraceae bacterium]